MHSKASSSYACHFSETQTNDCFCLHEGPFCNLHSWEQKFSTMKALESNKYWYYSSGTTAAAAGTRSILWVVTHDVEFISGERFLVHRRQLVLELISYL